MGLFSSGWLTPGTIFACSFPATLGSGETTATLTQESEKKEEYYESIIVS
jgi:hypothetical protein